MGDSRKLHTFPKSSKRPLYERCHIRGMLKTKYFIFNKEYYYKLWVWHRVIDGLKLIHILDVVLFICIKTCHLTRHKVKYKVDDCGNIIVRFLLFGNIIIKGSCDPTLGSWRFDETLDYSRLFYEWATKIQKLKIFRC